MLKAEFPCEYNVNYDMQYIPSTIMAFAGFKEKDRNDVVTDLDEAVRDVLRRSLHANP